MLGGEIVGCDALQVYRGFDAATAKPSREDRARVPHHLVDVADPRRDYSLADYVRDAEEAVAGIAARGRVPIVAGGTGMYLRGLLRGIVGAPPRDERLRRRLRAMAERFGAERLHRWLAGLDPGSAARLPRRDTQRIVRALEIALAHAGTWSERLEREGTWALAGERYPATKVGLDLPRATLGARLDARVEAFFEAGLVDEVRGLLDSGVPPAANAFKAIGYREVLAAVVSGADPGAEHVRSSVRTATRRYAKRQRTWLRKEHGLVWIDASAGEEATALEVAALWRARA